MKLETLFQMQKDFEDKHVDLKHSAKLRDKND